MTSLVTSVAVTLSPGEERNRGLLAYLALTILDVLRVDGVTVRRQLDEVPRQLDCAHHAEDMGDAA